MAGTAVPTTAKKAKRCPSCRKMIAVGEAIVLTDDRYMIGDVQWFGRSYQRGAWHNWHPACFEQTRTPKEG